MPPLEITIWDVNHGSAAYIKTPNNKHIVVDLGDRGKDFSPLGTLYSRGITQLDTVVITHPHADHIDDIFRFDSLSPAVLWRPKHLSVADIKKGNRALDMPLVEKYLEINQRYNAPLSAAIDITVPTSFGGASFEVFAPKRSETSNLNNHSLVVVASYAGQKMVIPGDNEAPSWKELLEDSRFVSAVKGAAILLASHHGRENGYCGELFEAMGKPRLVVVSDGRFGDTSATSRYSSQARGWDVFDSAGQKDERKCLTTRCDGDINIKFGWNYGDVTKGSYINVRTSKVNMEALVGRFLSGA